MIYNLGPSFRLVASPTRFSQGTVTPTNPWGFDGDVHERALLKLDYHEQIFTLRDGLITTTTGEKAVVTDALGDGRAGEEVHGGVGFACDCCVNQ